MEACIKNPALATLKVCEGNSLTLYLKGHLGTTNSFLSQNVSVSTAVAYSNDDFLNLVFYINNIKSILTREFLSQILKLPIPALSKISL